VSEPARSHEVAIPENSTLPAPGTTAAPAVLDNVFDIKGAQARLAQLREFFKVVMVEGEDYGVIPGTEKKSLWKPGAEKLCEFYRIIQRPHVTHRVEDWTKPFFHYEFSMDLLSRDTGQIVGTGVGSCNSMEARYRWRNGQRRCPECGQGSIFKSKREGEGFYCWAKKGGCGAQFDADDEGITSQEFGRVENDDVHSLVNTILKMGKKRSLVDAVVSVTRSAGLLIEEGDDDDDDDEGRGRGGNPRGGGARGGAADTVSEAERKRVADAFAKAGHKWPEVVAWATRVHKIDLSTQGIPKALYEAILKRVSDPTPLAQQDLV